LPPARLEHAFTHASWAADRAESYERLEFLGDSVLELAVAQALYERYPDFPEGRLAKIRSHVVSRQSCAKVAKELDLGPMLASRGGDSLPREELERLVSNRNVLAALLEAALAAAFLEWGFEKVEPAIVDAQGPAHDRHFTCAALVDGVESGVGTGRTKKEAEQEAAREALELLRPETS
jgi:ribonuclease-3